MSTVTTAGSPRKVSLSMVSDKSKSNGKGPGYTPTMPRAELKALTARLMACETMADAAAILRETAKGMEQGKHTWGFYLLKLATALETGKPGFAVFAEGNSKLPFYAFSALPQFTCPGAGSCLDWCYSFTGWRHPAAWARQVQNTLFLRHNKAAIIDAFHQLPQNVVVRLYVDGDFDSYETVNFWFALLDSRPDLSAYGYSKSWRLLWDYAQLHTVPANYTLNLSSGEREQGVSREQMRALPFVRGDFIALPIDYRPEGHKGNIGNDRYDDPEYHRAVRKAAAEAGLGKVFSCPGDCGKCCGATHACGIGSLSLPIVIGIH